MTGTGAADTSQLGLQNAVPTASFTNEASLAAAITTNQLRPGTVAVQYAPSSPVTPRNQLTDPTDAFLQASLVAHQHGLLLIGAPSLNIVKATAPDLKAIKRTSKFLQRRIAAAAARYSDVYVIQAQSLERTPSRFSAFVRQAAAQAVNAHPSVEILAEIRSGAGAGAPTAADARTGSEQRRLGGLGLRSDRPVVGGSDAASAERCRGGVIESFAGQG